MRQPRPLPTGWGFVFKYQNFNNMQKHTFNIFPEMQPEDYARLRGDLAANGYDKTQPIWLFEGAIIDGWNRYKACAELNIIPVYETFTGGKLEAFEFVMRTNKRRNLNSGQWAAIAVEAEVIVAQVKDVIETERRKAIAQQMEGNENRKQEKQMVQLIVPSEKTEKQEPKDTTKLATAKIAEMFNTNRTYISDAQKLKEEAPELFEAVKAGEKTITEVKKEQKIEARKKEIESQKKAIESGTAKMPEGVFEVIAIDPPWNYGREYDPDSSRVANPYPEMSQDELKQLQIPFADNCVVFLWTTHAFIQDAFELLSFWGVTYKATLVWDKEKIGMGAWLRMQCEFCLVGIKGSPIWHNTTNRDIIRESRRQHSRKPEAFYDLVNSVTVGRKLDFFSREKREGWQTYGNDTEKF